MKLFFYWVEKKLDNKAQVWYNVYINRSNKTID